MKILGILALGNAAGWLALRLRPDLRTQVPETIAILLGTSLFYLVSVFWIRKFDGKFRQKYLIGFILLAALLFRGLAWPLYPAFSNDPFRYRWEGKLQAAGGNPYAVAPADARWEHLRDETFSQVVLPEFRTIYGPLLELIHWLTYECVRGLPAFSQVFWFKFPSALADVGVLGAILAWLRARGWPGERLLIYAWCPLPIFEFWVNGHNDSWALLGIVLALRQAARARWTWAFTWMSLAAAAKIWPLLLVPFLMGRRWRWPVLWVPVVWIPFAAWYWTDITVNAQYVTGFLGGWRNNDSVYGAVLALTGGVYAAKYVTFGLLAVWVAWVWWQNWAPEQAGLAGLMGLLILSANVHPWYLTWVIPFLVVESPAALLLWVSLVPLSYEVLLSYYAVGEWHGVTPHRWWIYGPVFGLLAANAIQLRRRANQ